MMVAVHVQQTGVPTARCRPSHTRLAIAANFKPTHPPTSDSFGKYLGNTAGKGSRFRDLFQFQHSGSVFIFLRPYQWLL